MLTICSKSDLLMMFLFDTLLASLVMMAGVGISAATPVTKVTVRTKAGLVSGKPVHADTRVVAFKGIPYAQPPVGKLRWKPPQPPRPWSGVRPADWYGDGCVQNTTEHPLPWTHVFTTQLPVSENCLFVNVWTPKAQRGANLPVVVFIYGGGYFVGASSIRIYNGAHLADDGVVVVSFNYRLGVFGFFANRQLAQESPHHAAGNYGLLDQVAALRWVKNNIAAFGGNPHDVMIWGQSAGAMSVEALVLSPLAKGLFQYAQADSGLAAHGFGGESLSDAERNGAAFAKSIGASSLSALRAIPAKQLLRDAEHYRKKVGKPLFWPDVDGWVLPNSLRKLTVTGSGSDVPIITGWNADDWRLFQSQISSVSQYKQRARKYYGSMSTQFLKLYPAATTAEAEKMQALSSQDRERVQTSLWLARRHKSGKDASPVYLYFFQRAIPWPKHPDFGAFHTSELAYFFRNLGFMQRPWKPLDYRLSNVMARYLVNFAATGNPNRPGLPYWKPLGPGSRPVMKFGSNGHVGDISVCSSAKRCTFWRKYFSSADAHLAPPW